MAASTPRKRAPAKKAAARSADQRTESNLADFEEFRSRARGVRFGPTNAAIPPYVITAAKIADGNATDAVFQMPTSLTDRVMVTRLFSMVRRGQLDVIPEFLISLSDEVTFFRMMQAFDRETDPDALLFGLAAKLAEYFAGQGAADVPGGTTAS